MRRFFLALLCLVPLFCAACAGKQTQAPLADADSASRQQVDISDPGGPIPAPQLPPELAHSATAKTTQPEGTLSGKYAYTVECVVQNHAARSGRGALSDAQTTSPASPSRPLSDASSPEKPPARAQAQKNEPAPEEAALVDLFRANSILFRLAETLPEGRIGLEQRLTSALQEGRDILHSQGYYAGRVFGRVLGPGESSRRMGGAHAPADKALVRVVFMPEQRYTIGASRVLAKLPPAESMGGKDGERARDRLPVTLDDVKLPKGSPAVAADVLAAVDRVKDAFLQHGFPFAEVTGSRYIVDHRQKTLEAEITVTPGPFCRMGEIDIRGELSVRPAYIEALRSWRPGRPWRQSRIDDFREALRQSGLFQSIDITPGEQDKNGARPVVLTLAPAAERTVSGALKYHTDFGPGLQASWEHRNLSGKGDSLRITAPVWMDMQEVTASYRLPFFLRRDQDFIASGGFLNQDTDAYRLTSAAASAGLQRRLSRFLSGSIQGSVQGGNIKEPDEPARDYLMYGLPFTLSYDSTRNLLDAVKGHRVISSVAPYTGEYDGPFSVVRARVEGQSFIPLIDKDTLVLALKGVVGAVGGEHSDHIPPSIRFYSGGGGSVRGYEYQSIGPRNNDRKPLGGGSLVEVSTEARWKVQPEWGFVAFVDGGTAYADVFDDPGQDIRWGAGLGFRYYTVIGPVRVDVATPLNPRKDDDDIQFYLSIGQSF